MICKKCGRELPEDAKFCGVCGTPVATLTDFTAVPSEAAAPQPAAEAQQPSTPQGENPAQAAQNT